MARQGIYTRSSPAGNTGFVVKTVLNDGSYEYFLQLPSGGQVGPMKELDEKSVSIVPINQNSSVVKSGSKEFSISDPRDNNVLKSLDAATLIIEIRQAAKRTTDEIDYYYDPALTPDEEAAFKQYQKVDPVTGKIYYQAPPLDPKELNARVVPLVIPKSQEVAVREATMANQEQELELIRIATGRSGVIVPGPPVVSEPVQSFLSDFKPDPISVIADNYNPTAVSADDPILRPRPEPISVTTEDIVDGPLITGPIPTTDPSNLLPLGDDIYDIYDPNLTPEQVASLSAEDQEVRAEVLAARESGDAATLDENGEIVVTATREDNENNDWRVKLSLAPGSEYLYKSNKDAGILQPLVECNGVIFPYTPTVNVNYLANYEPASIVHNNYKVYQYSNSSVDTVTLTCEFTAQDDKEARYLLAVIHFFRSMTKMFFGQDQQPRAGTPPPLCYLRGMGAFQFNNHPLAITSFAYNLPNDVDYISTTGISTTGALGFSNNQSSSLRLPSNIRPGGVAPPPKFTSGSTGGSYDFDATWVPTKIQMSITCVPMMSRHDVSNEFSLEGYAQGNLYSDRGFW